MKDGVMDGECGARERNKRCKDVFDGKNTKRIGNLEELGVGIL
jgi:hypothetical protein